MNQEKIREISPNYISDYVFHYNVHTDEWTGIHRNHYNDYWNGTNTDRLIRSKHLNAILDLLQKADGDIDVAKDITGGQFK